MIAPMLDALATVHAADFLHRDIAPDNIMIRSDGSPVLIDFGAARGDIAEHSRTVSALVKPGYSPYEQYGEIGRQQGPWTDIYALAATIYHAITGKRPPDAPSRVVNDTIIPAREAALSAYRPSFLSAIDQGLRIDIDKRPQSIAEWRGALLAPEEEHVQRGWFGAKRSDTAPEPLASTVAIAATRPLPAPVPQDAGSLPPPPDVPLTHGAPVGRGRIVDFLDGVRRSPRDTSELAAPKKSTELGAEPRVIAGEVAVKVAPAEPVAAVPGKKGGGFFFRSAGAAQEQVTPASNEMIALNRPVEVRSAPNIFKRPDAAAGKAVNRTPPRPRRVRSKSAFRWFPLITKLAIGVVVATFLVKLQQSMPRFEFRSTSTVASSSSDQPRTVTSSIQRVQPRQAEKSRDLAGDKAREKARSSRTANAADVPRSEAKPAPKRSPATLLLRTFVAHAGGTAAVQFTGDGGKLATVGGDGLLKVWDAKTYTLVRTLELEDGPALALAVLGNRALTGHENGRVSLWDLDLGMQLKVFKRNDAPITSLVFAGPKKFLAGSNDWSVSLWEISTPSVPLHVFEGHGRDVLSVAIDPTRGLIASGGADKTVKLWETKSLSHVRTYPRARDFITAAAFSPDGDGLLIGTLSGAISLYSTNNRSRKRRYRGHEERVTSLTFIGGGREFVSASSDGTVRLWNRREGRSLQTYGSAGAKISNAAVSPDGRFIAAGKDNGTVQIWNGVVLD
jgi:WD40 repeat protein